MFLMKTEGRIGEYRLALVNRLLNSVMKEYCEKNGIEYTQFNLPEEVLAAKQEFIDDLFQRNQHKIEYFIDTDSGT